VKYDGTIMIIMHWALVELRMRVVLHANWKWNGFKWNEMIEGFEKTLDCGAIE